MRNWRLFLSHPTDWKNVLLPKIHKTPPEIDFEFSRSSEKSESGNKPSRQCWVVLPTWQYCRQSLAWWMYEINLVNRLSHVWVHFVTALANLLTDDRMLGLPIRVKYKHFKTICEQTSDNSPTDSSSSNHPSKDLKLFGAASLFYLPARRNSFVVGEGIFSKNYGTDEQRLQVSDLHFDKFTTSATFACWKIRFKTEVWTCSQFLRKRCCGSKKWDDWINGWCQMSCSVEGIRTPDFKELDAKIASALNRIIHSTQFTKRWTDDG